MIYKWTKKNLSKMECLLKRELHTKFVCIEKQSMDCHYDWLAMIKISIVDTSQRFLYFVGIFNYTFIIFTFHRTTWKIHTRPKHKVKSFQSWKAIFFLPLFNATIEEILDDKKRRGTPLAFVFYPSLIS